MLDGFVGRDAATGLAAAVLEGEAGIGKSTLWDVGVARARERGFRVLRSRPAEVEIDVAHAGLSDLLEDVLREVLPELAAPQRRALEIALLLRDDADEPVDFRAVAVAVRSALQVLATRRPLLLAIDDVQWLDRSTTSVIAFALRRLEGEDVRVLLARRIDGAVSASALERAIDEERITRVSVGPLSPGALHTILHGRLGRGVPRPTLLRIRETSGGNPFFALELARASEPGARDGDPAALMPLPQVLGDLVQARVAEVPEQTRAVLLLVAAAGSANRALLRRAGVDDGALEPARRRGLISVSDEAVAFTHPLLASAVYHEAPDGDRRDAHAMLAEIVVDPVGRARHLALAAEGPDPHIAAALERAAARALLRGAPIAAAELGEDALRATPHDAHEDRRRRALSAARAHLGAGESARPRAIARELLDAAPAGAPRAEALALMADLEPMDRGIALLDEAAHEAAADPALQAKLRAELAGRGRLIRGLAWAEAQAREALRLAEELNDDTLRPRALSTLAMLRFDRGDPDGPRLAERAYELAAACGDREQRQDASWALGHVLMWSVETEKARALLELRYEDERDRDERASAEMLWYLSFVELRAGRWQLAYQHAERALEIDNEYGTPLPMSYIPVALIAAHRGELEHAASVAARARELAGEHGALLPAPVGLAGTVALWSGDAAAAATSFAAAEERADALEWGEPNLRQWRDDYVEALLALGRTHDAEGLLDDWEDAAKRVERAWVLARVTRCRGLVAAARGDVVEALALLEDAVRAHEEVSDRFGRARAMLALGVIRRRARQKRAARDAIASALEEFDALGAAGWAENARAELGRIGGRTRQDGLTSAERRVAELVADGRTNREVAAALFLAERTVSSHLSHVYAKLGVRSRTELARKLPRF